MDLSIVIVSFNQRAYLERCLETIRATLSDSTLQAEVFVVDNASEDGSLPMVRERFPRVRTIQNGENQGFSKANNQALALARGRYVLLLNNDTEVLPGALENLVFFADTHPDLGAVGPLLLDSAGKEHRLPASIFSPLYWSRKKAQRVSWIVGACVLLRRDALEQLGGLDEDFFFYYEDVDLGLKLKKAGLVSYFAPDARVIHHEKKSSELSSVKPLTLFHLYRGRLLLARKHYRWAFPFTKWAIALELWQKKGKWPHSELSLSQILASL